MSETLEEVVEPLRQCDFQILKDKAEFFKVTDRTGYLIGIVLEELVEYFQNHKPGEITIDPEWVASSTSYEGTVYGDYLRLEDTSPTTPERKLRRFGCSSCHLKFFRVRRPSVCPECKGNKIRLSSTRK